jgi:DNA-binding NarL/FixJ family response regulator
MTPPRLTPRQRQLLELLLTRDEKAEALAAEMHISVGTFKVYIAHMCKCLGTHGRIGLMVAEIKRARESEATLAGEVMMLRREIERAKA